jgi:hypothetical protein
MQHDCSSQRKDRLTVTSHAYPQHRATHQHVRQRHWPPVRAGADEFLRRATATMEGHPGELLFPPDPQITSLPSWRVLVTTPTSLAVGNGRNRPAQPASATMGAPLLHLSMGCQSMGSRAADWAWPNVSHEHHRASSFSIRIKLNNSNKVQTFITL